jgi:uncharacterized protein YidB (DUF937 family)
MGIFDKIESAVGSSGGEGNMNQQQHESLMQHAMQMFGSNQALSGLLGNAQSHGLGGIVQSWISKGENQPIQPNQVENLVGQERLQQLASRAGIPSSIAGIVLSRILPTVVDRLTPQGHIPEKVEQPATGTSGKDAA